jgi:hypothetical protein
MFLYLISLAGFLSTFNVFEGTVTDYCLKNKDTDLVKNIGDETDILTVKYRIVNLVKSSLLGFLCIPTFFLLNKVLFYPESVNYYQVNIFAALYASVDMAALIYNRKNHISTNIHHITVQVFYFYILYYDFAMINLVRPIITYACYSLFAYLVNGRLSIRKLDLKYENEINDLSLVVYINTSVSNWIAQLYLIFFDTPELPFFYTKMLYSILVFIIVSDDIFLMKYLYNYKRYGVK